MHTISYTNQPTMEVTIHNQCSDFKLTDAAYLLNNIGWVEPPNVEIDAGSMTRVDLLPLRMAFDGGLLYFLKRKHVETDNQLESNIYRLFIGWKHEGYKKLRAFVQLIECDKTFGWDKFKPEEYFQRYISQLSTYTGPIKDTWLIYDGTVLMTELELDFTKRDGRLNLTISEGVSDGHTKRPEWINLNR
jgi:hypothetical protein